MFDQRISLRAALRTALPLLLLGACVIVERPPPPIPAPPPRQPLPPAPPAVANAPHATPTPTPTPTPTLAPPHPVAVHLPPRPPTVVRFGRVAFPPPASNPVPANLNLPALRAMLRPNRKCGPREVPPGSGHYIHLDCNLHAPIRIAKPFSPRKLNLLAKGALKVDTPFVLRLGPTLGPAPSPNASGLPDSVDHRSDGTEGPIKDQGQVGACTAFSLSSAMDNAIRRQNKSDTTSSLHLWSHYGTPVVALAGEDNLNKPIATWELWPYDARVACELDRSGDGDCGPFAVPVVQGSAGADPQVQAKIRDSDAKGHWKVTEYDNLQTDPDTIAAILATGADVWFTMNIGATWQLPLGDTIPDWSADTVDGGHAVLFAGYRHKNGQRQFLVHNSWGPDWGDGGYAYISEGMLSFVKHAYKVVVVDTSQPSPPPPSDPNALTDDDCGEDQLVDSVTGRCAPICPDDSRPAGGQCGGAAGAKAPAHPVH